MSHTLEKYDYLENIKKLWLFLLFQNYLENMHLHAHIYMYICTHAHTNTYTHTHRYIHSYTYVYTCTCIYIQIHSHMQTYIHEHTHSSIHIHKLNRGNKRAQQINVPATKLGTHEVEGEDQHMQVVLWSSQMCYDTHAPLIHKNNNAI